jgi:hypothetical protein
MSVDLAAVRRRKMRWDLLLTLNNAQPYGAYEEMLHSVVQATFADATQHEVRVALDYLHDRRLIDVKKLPEGRWHAELTRHGVDLVEYEVDCEPGIARPAKYF